MVKWREVFFSLLNLLWSFCIIGPMIVLFWRGTWDILDQLLFPESADLDAASNDSRKEQSGLVSFLLGAAIRIVMDLSKFHLGEFLHAKPGLVRSVGGLLYTLVYAVAGVSFWRGTWYLMKLDVGEKSLQLTIVLIGGLTVLIASRISQSLIGAPLGLVRDTHDATFTVATYFVKTPADTAWWFVADVLFTNLVVRLIIVFCWWSLWSLEDGILIVNQMNVKDDMVAYDSLLLGYAAACLAYVMDKLLLASLTTKQYIVQPLRCLITLLAFFGSLNVWRGVWSCYDQFLFPDYPTADYVASAVGGFVVLALLRLSNTISNDMIINDVDDEAEIVNIRYFGGSPEKDSQDEMIPILE